MLGLIACAHTPDLPLRPDPTPPLDGSTVETFVARDHTQLLARRWHTSAAVRGVVVIMHGLKDYSWRYAAFAGRLTGAGYEVYAFDLRGHGRSAGPRVAPDDWLDYVDDLDRFLTSVETREPNRPIFLFGHSMGGAIAALTAERHRPWLAGLVLSGPALVVDAAPLLLAATQMAGTLTPHAPALKLPNGNFSSDRANEAVMDKDPLISQPPGPASTAAGLIDGIHQIWEGVDQLRMPLLALHGTDDKLTAPSGSRALVRAVPGVDKTLRIYEGFNHDLLHEPKGARVVDDIVAWLDAHTGGRDGAPPAVIESQRYDRPLAGDPRGWTQAVELGAGFAEGAHFAGDLAVEVARPEPFGWHAALTARIVGAYKTVALRPLGVAARLGDAIVGMSAGGALFSGVHFGYSGAGWLEVPLGPLHVGGLAEWTRRTTDTGLHGPLGSDALWTSVSVRLGGDRRYWPGARAGVGPVITGGVDWLGDAHAWVLTAGLQLFGED